MYLHSCPLFRLLPCLVCGHLSLDGCTAAEQNGARGSSKRRLEDGDCVRFESGSGWADIEGARQPAGLLQISLYSFFLFLSFFLPFFASSFSFSFRSFFLFFICLKFLLHFGGADSIQLAPDPSMRFLER